jgi:uncharacterized protein (TIGR02246 family)
MHIRCALVVVSVLATLSVGYFAQGQVREKAADAVKKGAAAGTKAPPPAAKADAGKKSADAAKSPAASSKPGSGTPAEDPDEKAIRASAESFTKLYNAHDVKGLAALFSPKAEMIDEDDNVMKGREAIEKEFAKVFKDHPTSSMEVDVDSVRVLTPMLAIEEGTARSKDSPNAPEDVTVYVAIHVKADGKWQLACVRDWDAPASELSPHELLERDLSWLVGEWIEESPDSVIHSVCKWHDNGNFLMQEFQVNVAGEIAMSGTMRIGWNAVTKQFQSWVFDSHGGHSTGFWMQDGDHWIVKMQGATATGEVGSSTNSYRPIDRDTIAWASFDRVIDGERQEDIEEIVVKRRPPLPAE